MGEIIMGAIKEKPLVKPGSCNGCALYNASMMSPLPAGKIDILVVGGSPTERDIEKWAFSSGSSQMVRSIFSELTRNLPKNKVPKIEYAYAVRCCAHEVDKKVNADMVGQCSALLHMDVKRVSPDVILLLGADALRAFNYKEGIGSYRGNIYQETVAGVPVNIVPSYHPVALRKSPGLVPTFRRDLGKALSVWANGVNPPKMDLRLPVTFSGIMAQLDELEKFLEGHDKRVGVALDTEATSLKPWEKEFRMIALSLAWDADNPKGLAFPVDHRKAKLTLNEREQICQRLTQILRDSGKVSLIAHNCKFDEKVVNMAYGLDLPPVVWDTMLGEHQIDEDKKGVYGLKQLTLDRFPGMGKYEAELHQHLDNLAHTRKAKYDKMVKRYIAKLVSVAVPFWEAIGEDQRMSLLSSWVSSGAIKKYSNNAIELSYKKRTKKQIENNTPTQLYKKCETATAKLFASLPTEHLPEQIRHRVAQYTPNDSLLDKPTFEDVPIETMLYYAAIDAVVTLLICRDQRKDIQAEAQSLMHLQRTRLKGRLRNAKSILHPFSNITMPLNRVLTDIEYQGVRLDRDKIKRYSHYLAGEIEKSEDNLFQQAGYRFNPQSGPDLAKLLFDDLKLPVLKTSLKTNDPSTDKAVLNDLYEDHPIPILKELLMHRKLSKCKSTYLENWLERSAYDGRLHASFNTNGTATHRLSSSNPNLQNVMFYLHGVADPDGATYEDGSPKPMNIKSVFLPDSDEYDLYDLDIANAEMRVLCAYSRDAALTKAFNEGMDLHCLTASAIGDYTYEEIKANKENKGSPHYKLRQLAKAVNFGTIYCMSASTLVRNLWENNRVVITEKEAEAYLDKFFEGYPGVADYIKRTQLFVGRYHFAHTYIGRLRRFPILAYNSRERNRVGRQAVNARIQSTSADIVATNMIDVDREILKQNDGRMLLTVHDSMVFQLPKGLDGGEVRSMLDKSILDNVREKFPWLPVPWKYDVDRGPNYGTTSGF
jgi:uracil-DNA glycosylase family 4